MNIPDLRSLPETEAVERTIAKLASDPMLPTMQELLAWCILRDQEWAVLKEKREAAAAAFAAAWADVPPTVAHDGAVYRKADTCWTQDGSGMLGASSRVSDAVVRAAWEATRPRAASVSLLRDSSDE